MLYVYMYMCVYIYIYTLASTTLNSDEFSSMEINSDIDDIHAAWGCSSLPNVRSCGDKNWETTSTVQVGISIHLPYGKLR